MVSEFSESRGRRRWSKILRAIGQLEKIGDNVYLGPMDLDVDGVLDDNVVKIAADMPGVREKNIIILPAGDNALSIDVWEWDREYHAIVELPIEIDFCGIRRSYRNGVLYIEAPIKRA